MEEEREREKDQETGEGKREGEQKRGTPGETLSKREGGREERNERD